MSQDPIREMRLRQQETKRARSDDHYVMALMDGNAPSAVAFVAALDAGHTGETALDAARRIDQAAATFFNQPADPPPAA